MLGNIVRGSRPRKGGPKPIGVKSAGAVACRHPTTRPEGFLMTAESSSLQVETYRFADDGVVPNNLLPLVVYRGVLAEGGARAAACEAMVARNGWAGAWRH